MSKISRDDIKKRGIKRFFNSFKYSVEGLKYAYRYEQSMLIHTVFTIIVMILNIVLHVSGFEWLIMIICIAMTLAAELINTAIEAAVDFTSLEINPLAKIAKDCSSAATFVLSLVAIAIGLVVYIPYVLKLLGI